MAKREITCVIDATDLTVTWKAEGREDLVLHMEKVHEDNVTYAALHGMKQRVTDAGALSAGSLVGEKFAEMQAIVEHYESGAAEWNRKGSGGGARIDAGLVVECIAALHAKGDIDRANRIVEGYVAKHGGSRDDAIKAFYDTADLKPEYVRRAAIRGAKKSSASILEGIDDIE